MKFQTQDGNVIEQVRQNNEEYVRIHFTKNDYEDIPLSFFQSMFDEISKQWDKISTVQKSWNDLEFTLEVEPHASGNRVEATFILSSNFALDRLDCITYDAATHSYDVEKNSLMNMLFSNQLDQTKPKLQATLNPYLHK